MGSNKLLDQQRLTSQRIAWAKFESPEETVRWMGALQAQDYTQAVWAIGVRTKAGTLGRIEQALADKKIVRTWPMRGTLHFVPSEDAKWMVRLSAARSLASTRRRDEDLGLTGPIHARSQQLFYDALSGGRCLPRPAMMSLLENAGIRTEGQRGYHILWNAAQNGLIAIGPMASKQQTFVLLEDWAPDARDLPRDEALAELARRYFTSHGPATLNDFAWWSGQTLGDARSGLVAIKSELMAMKINEKEYWMTGEDADPMPDPEAVFLLPGFDEYLLGYTDRSLVLASEHFPKIIPGGNGVFKPILVAGGQVRGTWVRSIKKGRVEITVIPFTSQAVDKGRVYQAAQDYANFLEHPLADVVFRPIESIPSV